MDINLDEFEKGMLKQLSRNGPRRLVRYQVAETLLPIFEGLSPNTERYDRAMNLLTTISDATEEPMVCDIHQRRENARKVIDDKKARLQGIKDLICRYNELNYADFAKYRAMSEIISRLQQEEGIDDDLPDLTSIRGFEAMDVWRDFDLQKSNDPIFLETLRSVYVAFEDSLSSLDALQKSVAAEGAAMDAMLLKIPNVEGRLADAYTGIQGPRMSEGDARVVSRSLSQFDEFGSGAIYNFTTRRMDAGEDIILAFIGKERGALMFGNTLSEQGLLPLILANGASPLRQMSCYIYSTGAPAKPETDLNAAADMMMKGQDTVILKYERGRGGGGGGGGMISVCLAPDHNQEYDDYVRFALGSHHIEELSTLADKHLLNTLRELTQGDKWPIIAFGSAE